MDYGTLFGGVSTEALAAITDIIPLGITVMVALVGIGIAVRVFAKFGVKR